MGRRKRRREIGKKGNSPHGSQRTQRRGSVRRVVGKGKSPLEAGATEALAAADEVDDFVTVAGDDECLAPFLAGEDFEVAFDGDAAVFEAEIAQEIDDGGAGDCGAGLAVYVDR
jgi:hypothetical protein